MPVLSPVLLATVGALLAAGAAGHLRSPAGLRRGLDAQGLLSLPLRRLVARRLPAVELALGAALLLAATGATGVVGARVAGGLAALLSAGFTAYLWTVLRDAGGRPVPCACGLGDVPVSRSTVARAGAMTVFAAAGALTAAGWSPGSVPGHQSFVAVVAAATLSLSLALLPAARAVPEGLSLSGGPQ